MAVTSSRIEVSTTPTPLMTVEVSGVYGSSTAIKNLDLSTTVFLGGANVTVETGYPLEAGVELTLDADRYDVVYAVVATGSVMVAVLRTGT